jgi:hypothetical protein
MALFALRRLEALIFRVLDFLQRGMDMVAKKHERDLPADVCTGQIHIVGWFYWFCGWQGVKHLCPLFDRLNAEVAVFTHINSMSVS